MLDRDRDRARTLKDFFNFLSSLFKTGNNVASVQANTQ